MLPQLLETGWNILPGVETVPCQRQLIERGGIELFEPEARQDLLQHSSMQDVEFRIGNAACANLLHSRLVLTTPRVCERLPVNGISAGP